MIRCGSVPRYEPERRGRDSAIQLCALIRQVYLVFKVKDDQGSPALLPKPLALIGRSRRLLGMWPSSHTVEVGRSSPKLDMNWQTGTVQPPLSLDKRGLYRG